MSDLQVAVCILFHEKPEQTIQSIQSFLKSQCPIYVLNNGSSDDSRKTLGKFCDAHSQITLIDREQNLGVSKGRNVLIDRVQESWMFFIDNDIYVKTPDWKDRLAAHVSANGEAEVFIPKMFLAHENRYQDNSNIKIEGNRFLFDDVTDAQVNSFPGGASIISRRLFERLGHYDDEMFVGFEDYEFALRALTSGEPIKAFVINDIEIVHDHVKPTNETDQKAVKVRYDGDVIEASHQRIQEKYGVEIDGDFKGWAKRQEDKMLGKLRIVYFINSGFPTLSETFILNQIVGFINLGHDVQIFANHPSKDQVFHGDIEKYDLLGKTRYFDYSKQGSLRRLLSLLVILLRTYLRNRSLFDKCKAAYKSFRANYGLNIFRLIPFFENNDDFDIIKCHFAHNADCAVDLRDAGLIKGKIVTTFHGMDTRWGISEGGQVYNNLFAKGEKFLSISTYNYDHLVEFGCPKEKIIHHPVGIDCALFQRNKKISDGKRGVQILCIARLVKEKGIHFAVRAAVELKNKDPDKEWTLTIVGDGRLKNDIEILIEESGVEDRVVLVGAQPQESVVQFLKESDILILTSVSEALPVSVMEAQACGLPVVATRVGSMEELIVDGKSGFIVESENPSAIADRLYYLLTHENVWDEMGQCGRTHVNDHFDVNMLNKRLEKVFKEML